MMGPEAMGVQVVNLDWWDERVCRNFLFGTCPHLIFGNTVSWDFAKCARYSSQTGFNVASSEALFFACILDLPRQSG